MRCPPHLKLVAPHSLAKRVKNPAGHFGFDFDEV
jgi:hypothetical protein